MGGTQNKIWGGGTLFLLIYLDLGFTVLLKFHKFSKMLGGGYDLK